MPLVISKSPWKNAVIMSGGTLQKLDKSFEMFWKTAKLLKKPMINAKVITNEQMFRVDCRAAFTELVKACGRLSEVQEAVGFSTGGSLRKAPVITPVRIAVHA